jgi:hypothetical protein
VIAAAAPGARLESWSTLVFLLLAFAGIVVALAIIGRRAARATSNVAAASDPLLWVPYGLERISGIPAWAAGMVGTAAFGLLVAGIGFYNDVAWHVGRGRDKELFTAPHTMIVIGLGFIALGAAVGILFATLTRADTTLRVSALRIPWSAVPLGLLGICALGGFPLDDLWHASYGIDVTMWSPTHMLMICGAAFSLIAAWLALAEAGVGFRDSRWSRVAHFVAAWFVLAGLSAPLGEFRFGVPQFQQLYHPVLLCLAAAFAFVPTRLVLGRGWALLLAVFTFVPEALDIGSGSSAAGFVPTRTVGTFVASAVAVELAALLVGTEHRLRFALVSGLGVGTLGLAGEWAWNQGAAQPWTTALLPGAILVGGLMALGAAVLGAAYGGAVLRDPGRLPRTAVALATIAVVAALLLPLPRRTGSVNAAMDIQPVAAGDAATVQVRLDPAGAADDAKWFQVIAWQGGGLRAVDLHETAPGVWQTEQPVPIGGKWKTMVRLHRGDELMAVPVFLPADPEIGAPEIPAVSRTLAFGGEEQYLMREVTPGAATVKVLAYAIIAIVALLWAGSFVLAAKRIPRTAVVRGGLGYLSRREAPAQTAATPPTTAMSTLPATGARARSSSRG